MRTVPRNHSLSSNRRVHLLVVKARPVLPCRTEKAVRGTHAETFKGKFHVPRSMRFTGHTHTFQCFPHLIPQQHSRAKPMAYAVEVGLSNDDVALLDTSLHSMKAQAQRAKSTACN